MSQLPVPVNQDVTVGDDVMRDLNIPPEEYLDFHRILKVLLRQVTDRVSVRRACQLEGFSRTNYYTPYWQRLLAKANIYIARPLTHIIDSTQSVVIENWSDLVNEAIRIGLNGDDEGIRLKAIELLHRIAIEPAKTIQRDDSPEQVYLKNAAQRDFNPLAPIIAIQAQPGSTINVRRDFEATAEDAK